MKKNMFQAIILSMLSILIPIIIILCALVGLRIVPFGDNTLLISDGNALYVNYLGYVARAINGHEGILYSFEKGLGGNMMGSWGWFLLNPFFTLFALFDITGFPTAFTWVSVLNFATCGFTMYILLNDIYGHRLDNLIFSTAYALCGFLVANVFQMNFFTGVHALPILALGLRRILCNQSPLPYVLSLTYSLLTSFYFGFMLCTASLLIFSVLFFCNHVNFENKKNIVTKYIISSLLAGTLSAVVWLPALLSLRGGRLDQSVIHAISFRENMPFMYMATKLFTGANTVNELSNGLPNIFVGILPVALVILFFMNNRIDRRRKIAASLLLAIYLISFFIPTFNMVMHGGTTTNWFNYRDSFVFSFLLLMIATEEWQFITEETKENYGRTAIILLISTIVVFGRTFEHVTAGEVLFDFVILALMALALCMHLHNSIKNPKSIFTLIVLLLMCVNLYANYEISTKNIMKWGETESDYQKVVFPVSTLVDAVDSSDEGFYRMEIGEQRSGNLGNDPMLYGYNGVGHGGSDDVDFVRNALSKLGIHRFDMRNHYGKGIPAATDALLGLKYLISKDNLVEEKSYEKLVNVGEWTLYKNPLALSIAMLTERNIEDVEIDYTDVFKNLNQTWTAISGIEESVFYEESDITFISHNVTDSLSLNRETAEEIVKARDEAHDSNASDSADGSNSIAPEYRNAGSLKEPPENMPYIEYRWIAKKDGPIYSYNRSGVMDDKGAIIPAMIYEGYYRAGESVVGYLPVTTDFVSQYVLEDVAGRFRAAYADNDALAQLSEVIRNRPTSIEKITDSHLRGDFTAEEGQILLFTIPFDEGWTCWIDGEKVEIGKTLDLFMMVDAPTGTHTYEMVFIPTGLKVGGYISAIAVIATVIYVFMDRRRRKRMSYI